MSKNAKATYLVFCQKEKEIPLFSQPWYLDAVCGSDGWDILIIQKGEEIAATMPFQTYSKFGFRLSRIPLFTKYWGPYLPKKFRHPKQQQKLIRQLMTQLPRFALFEQGLHPNITEWLPFHWEGFEATTRYTFIIEPLDDLERIYKNLDADYRNNKIPKAKKNIQITSDRSIEELFELQKKTYGRQGLSPSITLEYLKNFDAILEKKQARQMFFAIDDNNRIHSAVYLIWDESTAYFLMAGDDPDLRNSGAGILLTWHTIQYAKEVLGKNRFDFLGSMIEPITRVRRNFGATQTPFFHIKKFNSKFLRILFELKNG